MKQKNYLTFTREIVSRFQEVFPGHGELSFEEIYEMRAISWEVSEFFEDFERYLPLEDRDHYPPTDTVGRILGVSAKQLPLRLVIPALKESPSEGALGDSPRARFLEEARQKFTSKLYKLYLDDPKAFRLEDHVFIEGTWEGDEDA